MLRQMLTQFPDLSPSRASLFPHISPLLGVSRRITAVIVAALLTTIALRGIVPCESLETDEIVVSGPGGIRAFVIVSIIFVAGS